MFWSEYPWWKHLLPNTSFSSFPIDRPPVPLPPGTTLLALQRTSPSSDLERILPATCEFLYHHFARTDSHPRLTYTPDTLLGPHDILFVLLQKGSSPPAIAGTLRYRYLGTFQHTDKPVSLVDTFCIHPAWRGKGLGSFLLTALHRTANQQKRPYALFLKEGAPLPYPVRPALSGQYVYRELSSVSPPSSLSPPSPLLPLSPHQAHRWMRLYLSSFPSTFLILPPPSPPSHHWFAYSSSTASILVCVQDAHQHWKGGHIGWVTAWLETPTVTPSLRHMVSNALSHAVAPHYQWLWIERTWVGEPMSPEWIEDGAFHWYTYQWTTTFRSSSYAITS